MNPFSFKLLPDHPIVDETQPIAFGHKTIVETLEQVITNCVTPFTIGLFGKWGTGKSTIAEQLKSKLLREQIPTVFFDVWKHEGDALRRTFLAEMVAQLNVFDNTPLLTKKIIPDDRLYTGKTINKQSFIFQSERLLFHLCVLIPVYIIIWLLTIFGFPLLGFAAPSSAQLTAITTVLVGTTFAALVIKYVDSFIEARKTDIKQDRLQDPHEFEQEFQRILSFVAAKRLLIIFDNLDRVSPAVAVSTIATIKTFLEPARVQKGPELVFLVPCDVAAIRVHLTKIAGTEAQSERQEAYGDEFLRKFFNTVLWIPEFYQAELQDFTRNKLRETEVPEFNNVHIVWLINKVFHQNIRQIIQFINVLTTNYALLRNNSASGNLDKNFYNDNLPQLAKYLLLLQRFPQFMDQCKERSIYHLEEGNFQSERLGELPGYKAFRRFLTDTDQVAIRSLEPFITNKVSEDERKLEGVTPWLQELTAGRYEPDRERMDALQLNDAKRYGPFCSFVVEWTQKLDPISGTIFVNNLLHCLQEMGLTLGSTNYFDIANKVAESEWLSKIGNIHPLRLKYMFDQIPAQNSVKLEPVCSAQVNWVRDLTAATTVLSAEEYAYMQSCMQEWVRQLPGFSKPIRNEIFGVLLNNGYRFPELLQIALKDSHPGWDIDPAIIQNFTGMLQLADYMERDELATRRMAALREVNWQRIPVDFQRTILQGITAQISTVSSDSPLADLKQVASAFFGNLTHLILAILPFIPQGKEVPEIPTSMGRLVLEIKNLALKHTIEQLYLLPLALECKKRADLQDYLQEVFPSFKISDDKTNIEAELLFLEQNLSDKEALFNDPVIEPQVSRLFTDPELYRQARHWISLPPKVARISYLITLTGVDPIPRYLDLAIEPSLLSAINGLIYLAICENTADKLWMVCLLADDVCDSAVIRELVLARMLVRKSSPIDHLYFTILFAAFRQVPITVGLMENYIHAFLQQPQAKEPLFINRFHQDFIPLLEEKDKHELRDYFYRISQDPRCPPAISAQSDLIFHWLDKDLPDDYQPQKARRGPLAIRYEASLHPRDSQSDAQLWYVMYDDQGIPVHPNAPSPPPPPPPKRPLPPSATDPR